jgi:WD40-like Beta Propeller Repeat
MKFNLLLTSVLFLLVFSATAQISKPEFKLKFDEASKMMEEKNYDEAVKIWQELLATDQYNGNINYKIGYCYINSYNEKNKASQYLKTAISLGTSKDYDITNAAETKAPKEAQFYYANALHLNYKFDDAIIEYGSFISAVGSKHYLIKNAQHEIEICKNAKTLIKDPKKYLITNIGSTVNNRYPDYSPVVSLDENALFFTSRRMRADSSNNGIIDNATGEFFEDIYVSYRNRQGQWQAPELLNINTTNHDATINVSADGQTLFIYKDDGGNGNIYESKLVGEIWSDPQKMGSDINTSAWETHVALTGDGNTLYFVSDRTGGFGGRDIYRCIKLPNGEWSKALTVGPVINTPWDEEAVFVHPDGKTLYFSSKGHTSMGGFDIFSSKIGEDGNWSEPENIGYPINTTEDDVFFVTSADGKRGYYSSAKADGYGDKDIYIIDLPGKEFESCLAVLKGYVVAPEGTKIPESTMIYVTNTETGITKSFKPRQRDGVFVAILPPCIEYNIDYRVNGKSISNEYMKIPCEACYQEINKEITLNGLNIDQSVVKTLSMDGTIKDQKGLTQTRKTDGTTTTITTTDGKNTYVTKAEIGTAVYDKYFKYNKKDIDLDEKRFNIFMNDLTDMISKFGKVEVSIEGSASKVPTATFVNNENLAEKRVADAKLIVLKGIKDRNISAEKIIFKDENAVVQGPEYKNDPVAGEAKYEKFQYIKITVR